MRVFRLCGADVTGYLSPSHKNTSTAIDKTWLHGRLIQSDIETIPVNWHENHCTWKPDILPMSLSDRMTFSDRVKTHLIERGLVEGQWFRLDSDEVEMWLFHNLSVVDALNESDSSLQIRGEKVTGIKSYSMNKSEIPENGLFAVKTCPYDLLCGESFKKLVSDSSWRGFNFEPVWDSEHDPFSIYPTTKEILSRPEVFGPEGFIRGFEDAWPADWKSNAGPQ